ncbi:MAG: hypothetical protein JEZ05_07670 [Tenericutes bacterium]|nr:hypothetical protein [Mycoplasmatota bacterium]
MNKKIVYSYFTIVVLLEIIGLFVLPELVVMQINTQGEANWSINKFLAIPVMFVISIGAGMYVLKSGEKTRNGYMILAVFLICHFVIYFFN